MTCCCLHNFLLDVMERSTVRVGCGYPICDDGIWLSGNSSNVDDSCEDALSIKFGLRRDKLVKHLKVFKEKGIVKRMATDKSLFYQAMTNLCVVRPAVFFWHGKCLSHWQGYGPFLSPNDFSILHAFFH